MVKGNGASRSRHLRPVEDLETQTAVDSPSRPFVVDDFVFDSSEIFDAKEWLDEVRHVIPEVDLDLLISTQAVIDRAEQINPDGYSANSKALIIEIVQHAFSVDGITLECDGLKYSKVPEFAGLSDVDALKFASGLAQNLTALFAASELVKRADLEDIDDLEGDDIFPAFSDLTQEEQSEVVAELLNDSLEMYSQMRGMGYKGDPGYAGQNSPAIYFPNNVVLSPIERFIYQRKTGAQIKGLDELQTPADVIDFVLDQPIVNVKALKDSLQKSAVARAGAANHPTGGRPTLKVVPNGAHVNEGRESISGHDSTESAQVNNQTGVLLTFPSRDSR